MVVSLLGTAGGRYLRRAAAAGGRLTGVYRRRAAVLTGC